MDERLAFSVRAPGGYIGVLKDGYNYEGSRVVRADSAVALTSKVETSSRNDWWVTINGSHVLIKGNEIVGGAGGRLNGKKFGERFAGKYKSKAGYLSSEGTRRAGGVAASDGLGVKAKPKARRISKMSEAAAALSEIGFKDADMKSLGGLSPSLVVENVNRLSELESRFGAVTSIRANESAYGEYVVGIGAEDMGYRTAAYVRNYGAGYVALRFNQRLYANKAQRKKDMERQGKNNHLMPCDPALYTTYTVTHEYAHLIQYALFFRERKKQNEKRAKAGRNPDYEQSKDMEDAIRCKIESRCIKEIERIGRRSDPKFRLIDHLSNYGKTNYAEAFAEIFANSQCGAPNQAGDAINIWLKEKGFLS